MPKPSQGPPLRGALTGEVNLSVPVAQAGMYDDACIIHAEQMVAALLVTRMAIAQPGPVWTAHINATREILAMLMAEPERRTQQRRVAFTMALHPRLGVASPVSDLEPGLVRMVLETP